ncbi:MAG: hypothetical protein KIH65_004470 [Candidatus Uhrbacteria bacterium]|nr:hypothetical protein [Candidatus Uhrbacteria bacterium]
MKITKDTRLWFEGEDLICLEKPSYVTDDSESRWFTIRELMEKKCLTFVIQKERARGSFDLWYCTNEHIAVSIGCSQETTFTGAVKMIAPENVFYDSIQDWLRKSLRSISVEIEYDEAF